MCCGGTEKRHTAPLAFANIKEAISQWSQILKPQESLVRKPSSVNPLIACWYALQLILQVNSFACSL